MLHVTDLVKQIAVPARKKAEGEEPPRQHGIDGVTFDVMVGELFTLLGPSGCGKTTALRSIAGLKSSDAGQIALRETVFFGSATDADRR